MLTSYLQNTALLLQNPAAPSALYSTSNLTLFINTARNQLAGEYECIRIMASLATSANTQVYPFTSIGSLPASVQGISNVRMITRMATANRLLSDTGSILTDDSGSELLADNSSQSGGTVYVDAWPWEWFNRYFISQNPEASGPPLNWAQFAPGMTGSIYLDPIPDAIYTLNIDSVCYPVPLVDDTTPEAIPYEFTDAVPYMAAYYAYMSAQRQQDAQTMYQRYQEFGARARKAATPTVLPMQYSQAGTQQAATQQPQTQRAS